MTCPSDHLGSTSVTTTSSGAEVSTTGYYPFGETRYSTGTLPTDRLYTEQQSLASLGIYNYKARFYSPLLGRFLSADTVTPPGPQGLNRYSYGNNSPINFNDPTGHTSCGDLDNPQARAYCEAQAKDNGKGGLPGFGDDSNYVNTSTTKNDLLAELEQVAKLMNWRISSPVSFPIVGDKDYWWLGGINITHTPFIIYNNHSSMSLGTDEISYSNTFANDQLMIRTNVNSELINGIGVYTTQGIGDAMTMTGFSLPAFLNPMELRVNLRFQLSSSSLPITIGDTFTIKARWSPPGMVSTVLVPFVALIPESAPGFGLGLCRAVSLCP